jgi:hypothetical protein
MLQIYPDDGLLEVIFQIAGLNLSMRLFTNNIIPSKFDTVASYTEAAWAGYVRQNVNAGNFTISGVSGHAGYAYGPPIIFNNTSGGPVTSYGYFCVDQATNKLMFCARWDVGALVTPDGTTIGVIPILGDFSQYI